MALIFVTVTDATGCEITDSYTVLATNNIEVSIETLEGAILSFEGDLIQGGTISASATWVVTSPYTFSWSTGCFWKY